MKEIILSLALFVITIVILFFLLKLALGKLSYFKKRQVFKNIISILFAILIYFLISIFFFNSLIKIPKEKFDETVWKENITERHKMIDDLLRSDYLIGKTKNKIIEVFGKPENIIEEGVFKYKILDRTWADFKIIDLKLYFENDTVKKFEYSDKK